MYNHPHLGIFPWTYQVNLRTLQDFEALGGQFESLSEYMFLPLVGNIRTYEIYGFIICKSLGCHIRGEVLNTINNFIH